MQLISTSSSKFFKGFTLIELLVVIAIIGLLSTIIATPIQNARKKARDAKKIAEVKAVETALGQYADSNNGNYPKSIWMLSPQFMPTIPTNFGASSQIAPRDHAAYVVYEAIPFGGSASTTFGYHIGVHLEVYNPALESDKDCRNVHSGTAAPGNDLVGSTTCMVFNAAATGISSIAADWIPNGLGESAGSDFNGNGPDLLTLPAVATLEKATSTCGTVTECVFDVVGLQ